MAGDLVKIVLICFRTNDVDDLVEGHIRMLLTVLSCVVAKNLVIRDLRETHLRQVSQLPLPQLMLTQLFVGRCVDVQQVRIHISSLFRRIDCLFRKVLLCGDFDVFGEG